MAPLQALACTVYLHQGNLTFATTPAFLQSSGFLSSKLTLLHERRSFCRQVNRPFYSHKVFPGFGRDYYYSCKADPRPVTCSERTVSETPPSTSLWESIKNAPVEPGVYMFRDRVGQLLYIGKSKVLRDRVRSYFTRASSKPSGAQPAAGLSPRIEQMTKCTSSVEFVITKSEAAALALEASLVREHMPPYNVLLKDDKRYPCVCITFSEPYPRIFVTRRRRQDIVSPGFIRQRHNQEVKARDRLYGPFVDQGRLKAVLGAVQRAFPLRQRPRPLHKDRPCINYEIGRCPGVCQELISREDYDETVKRAEMVFTGRVREAIKYLEDKMMQAANSERYEEAAVWRDRVSALRSCFEGENVLDGAFSFQASDISAILGREASVSRDVAAVASSARTRTSVIIVFQVRDGMVVNRFAFSVGSKMNTGDGHLADAKADLLVALEQHYLNCRDARELPEEIVVSDHLGEEEMASLCAFVSERRGKAVRIIAAKRSAKPTSGIGVLVDVVRRNAKFEVQQAEQREKEVEEGLQSLRELLSPVFHSSERGFCTDKPSFLSLHRIECYDVSHTSGVAAVASRAVFKNGLPAPSLYRLYNLRNPESSALGNPNDYRSMQEVLTRRFEGIAGRSHSDWPDLVVIDGGKGQLSAAVNVLRNLNIQIPMIALAKRVEEVFVPGLSIALNMDEKGNVEMTDGVRLLCRIRDEAHRFAVQGHRDLRGRAMIRSSLDNVVGLGSAKRECLLRHFGGSAEAVAAASWEDLRKVKGIGDALAGRIYKFYHVDATAQ